MATETLSVNTLHAELVSKQAQLARLTCQLEDTEADRDRLKTSAWGHGGPALFEIVLEGDTMALLEQLFILIDTNRSGTLDSSDFHSAASGHFESMSMWNQFLDAFDTDGDKIITPNEFVNTFAKVAMGKIVHLSKSSDSFVNFKSEMQTMVTKFSTDEVMRIGAKVHELWTEQGNHMRSSKSESVAAVPRIIYKAYFRSEVYDKMQQVFRMLKDQSKQADTEHCITAESFRAAGACMGNWENVLRYFDKDESGTIDEAEFVSGFVQWIQNEEIVLPMVDQTIKEFMCLIGDRANDLVLKKLDDFEKHCGTSSEASIGMVHFRENQFTLERYFAKWEFKARFLLCCSDCEAVGLQDTLAAADRQSRTMWDNMTLAYTESNGLPALRQEVAALYSGVDHEGVLIGTPQELILIGLSGIISAGDHVLVTWPGYQSLYETCIAMGATIDFLNVAHPQFNLLSEIKKYENSQTKALILNLPHNPTGYLPTLQEYEAVVSLAKRRGWILFSDEMYRWLEYDPSDRLPSACEVYDRAVTLSGCSKSLSMPGIRVGWLATRDVQLLKEISKLKDYTTICTPGPSEILALMALRNRESLVGNNMELLNSNLKLVQQFFDQFSDLVKFVPPKAGSICFPRIVADKIKNSTVLCQKLVDEYGVLLLPGTVYEHSRVDFHMNDRFRMGLGRKHIEQALEEFGKFLQSIR